MEQKQTNKKGDRVVRSLYLLYLGYILGAVLLIVRIVQLQLTYQPDERIADLFHPRNIKEQLDPERGSILAHDGRLIAMSTPMYQVYMDCAVLKREYRDMKDKEKEACKAKNINPVRTTIAVDAIVPVVNPGNPLKEITSEQLKDIYAGKITNWKEVGGKDGKIVVVSRDSSSGTFECWNELIMKKERVAPSALMQASNGAVVQAVAKNPNAIGYIGLGYLNSSVKGLHVDKKEPTAQNALSKTWPISRELYIFTNGEPQGDAKALVTYLLDPTKGQKNVAEVGYIPLGK